MEVFGGRLEIFGGRLEIFGGGLEIFEEIFDAACFMLRISRVSCSCSGVAEASIRDLLVFVT